MNGIKNCLAKCLRNEWPRRTIADVDYEIRAADVDVLEIEAGSCVIAETAEIRVERLLRRDGIPVNAERGNGVDDETQVLHGVLAARCGVLWSRRGCWGCGCVDGS